MNLDPFGKHTDCEVWEVLEHACLKTYVSSLPEQLEYQCSEGGANLRSVVNVYNVNKTT